MKLKEYLSTNNLTQHMFLDGLEKETGHKLSQSALSKYIIGQRIPRKNEMVALHEFTNQNGKGKVEPNDFYL
tara:strand:+ start:473 stop:688 length:216 start_codon:yes stop_codon:yes gene_type:complete